MQIKSSDGEGDSPSPRSGGRIVEGYASVFGNVDLHGDIVAPGAFAEAVSEFNSGSVSIPIYFEHAHLYGPILPVGHVLSLEEDKRGLKYEGEIVDTTAGLDLIKLLDAGSVGESSFQYRVYAEEFDDEGIRTLTKLGLREVSVVVWGANPETTSSLKSSGDLEASLRFILDLQKFNSAIRSPRGK